MTGFLKKKILVAPLDWGLGHATRCIPVIQALLEQGVDVIIASDGNNQALLKTEFPLLQHITLPGYNISYGKGPAWWHILLQAGKIRHSIKKEHQWLNHVIKEYNIDGVLSDNRYGLHTHLVPCALITHQLLIKSPMGFEQLIQKWIYKKINLFTQCWVADVEQQPSLAGQLSHPPVRPHIPIYYTGALTRFLKNKISASPNEEHVFISISGPEPQRSIFENSILEQLHNVHLPVTLVRGLPAERGIIPSTPSIRIYNHLPTVEYEQALQQATIVICRSGYSTLMDLSLTNKKILLVPTPGQTEQEYLAYYWAKQQWAIRYLQKEFDLLSAIKQATSFTPKPSTTAMHDTLAHTVHQFLNLL